MKGKPEKRITLSLSVGEIRTRRGCRVVRRDSYIEALPLLDALHTVKALAKEPHTIRNLEKLIDQVRQLRPTL